jgi:hypothetical protein
LSGTRARNAFEYGSLMLLGWGDEAAVSNRIIVVIRVSRRS